MILSRVDAERSTPAVQILRFLQELTARNHRRRPGETGTMPSSGGQLNVLFQDKADPRGPDV